MTFIFCDNCKGKCPHSYGQRNVYFSTTEYDGKFCGTGCALSWILKCKKNKINANKMTSFDGNIKMVFKNLNKNKP
jgi:hypothetical protein